MPGFEEWESFYVIVGAAAGALIGLQFVVMTLIAERPSARVGEAAGAFAKPTIIHFSAALLLSALIRIPFESITPAAMLWGLVGFSGVIYIAVIVRRIVVQHAYQPDLEDWVFHALLPFAAYAILVGSAFAANHHPHEGLLALGAAVLLLLFIGIHNAWDAVVFQVLTKKPDHP
jgi:hypothetical protein